MNYSRESNAKRRKNHNSAATKTKNKISIYIFRIIMAFVIVGGFALGGASIGAYFGIIEKAPVLGDIPAFEGSFTSIVYNSAGEEIDRLDAGESREYATMAQIPEAMKYAFIALEDERFYSHDGVDFKGFARGIYETLTSETPQGGSTITQQLIKNKLGIKRNTIETKLQEQYLAITYEKNLAEELGGSKEAAKEQILERYMNIVGLGSGQNGVQAAALFYFGKDVSELSIAECAAIAATTQSPEAKNPLKHPEANRKRQLVALDNMLEFGYITQKEYDEAVAEDVYSKIQEVTQISKDRPSFHSYFVDQVFDEVSKALQEKYNISPSEASYRIYNGGLKIYTTQDKAIQQIVDDAYMNEDLFSKKEFEIAITYEVEIRNTLTNKKKSFTETGNVKAWEDVDAFVKGKQDKLLGTDDEIVDDVTYAVPQPQSGMVVLDYRTGQVAAIAGGRGVKLTDRAFNRATNAERQPGSVFKILASYAPAIDLNLITPATVIDDVPFTLKGTNGAKDWTPRNWWGSSFRGLSTVRMGITQSMNIVTIKNMQNTGIEESFKYLKNFGFTTLVDSDKGLPTALGGITHGVTQLEVTAAFGSIANEGVLVKPVFFTGVLDHNGDVLLENVPETTTVLKKTSSFLLTSMMQDVVTRGTGGRAAFKNVKMPIAGKTGTTSGTNDLMFVGYTPYYAAGVYVGFDKPKEVKDTTTHLTIWNHVMEKIHQDLEYKEFVRPDGITTAKICTVSGKLAVDGLCDSDPRGNKTRTEYFAVGTVPTDYCDVHRRYKIDTVTGQAPTIDSLPEFVVEKVGIVRPIPYYGDATVEDRQYEVPASILGNQSAGGGGPLMPVTTPDVGSQDPIGPTLPDYINPALPSYTIPNYNDTFYTQPTPTPTPVTAPVTQQRPVTNGVTAPTAATGTPKPFGVDTP